MNRVVRLVVVLPSEVLPHQIHLNAPLFSVCVCSYVMRMKEYERERRLQMRKKRVEEAQAA
ncbi:unnamed protein product [Oncorhynchus mykiss]|uniref:Uncharacterized protein n=1 Tax=Oncorhynchus mykiss TaxID=8022 RepID=A0A060Z708_ONCMY|nr:unnamed protein product [Oncorhynchus mykiss]